MKKKTEGWVDEDGSWWFSGEYVVSKELIADAEARKELRQKVRDAVEKLSDINFVLLDYRKECLICKKRHNLFVRNEEPCFRCKVKEVFAEFLKEEYQDDI